MSGARIFARVSLECRTVVEYASAEAVDAAGAAGTEVIYHPETDSFSWDDGHKSSEALTPNPFPGHILAGAARVASVADAHRAQGWS